MSDEPERAPRTYLVWSALATVLCFFPLGLIALGFGLSAQQAFGRGDVELARRRGRVARGWLVAAIVVGLVVDLLLAGALTVLGAFSH